MAQQLFRVTDVFACSLGLIIVATDCTLDALPAVLRIGDSIEFRRLNASVFRTTIAGILVGRGPNPKRPFDFSLPHGTAKDEIEIGAETWLAQVICLRTIGSS